MDQINFSDAEYQTQEEKDPPRTLSEADGQAHPLDAVGEESSP